MITTVAEQVEGRQTKEVVGVVFGSGIAEPGSGSDAQSLHNMLEKAIAGMADQANHKSADAVIGVRLSVHHLGNSSLVLAYGTAVELDA